MFLGNLDFDVQGQKPRSNVENQNQVDKSNGLITSKNSSIKIQKLFNIKISSQVVSFHRKKLGYYWRRLKTRPQLSDDQINQRYFFARRYVNYCFNDVIFTDETTIKCHSNPLYHMRKKGKRPRAISVKKHAGKINIWAGISFKGPTKFVVFENNMDRYGYLGIIETHLNNFVKTKYRGYCKLIQDNDPKHTSRLYRQALIDNRIIWVRTPAQSPDINIIELLWSDLKRFVRSRDTTTINEIVKSVRIFEKSLTPEKCQKYINHCNKVLRAICLRKGHWSDH
ncbi:unnamed protein product [Brachionus calyciflorus]|uniref:Tc1-like transposase DDE domain-containing protein n=1 Tax=Brachionus calyciflorus TaxID=104777 RepID=A0A813YAH6_9BILA|nr:unnamed protein product [Brachionus calyciflorus]